MLRFAALAFFLFSSSIGRADLPDSAWLVVKDRAVVVELTSGIELRGKLVAIDAQTVTLFDESGRIVAVKRGDVAGVRAAQEQAPTDTPRHFGLQTYTGPGNFLVDVDWGRWYGYAGGSIGYPIIFSGQNTDQYIAGVVGAGGQWRLSPTSRWKLDLTGTLIPTYWGGFSIGIGISAGFHYTSASGFTVGFKIPVFGVAPGYNTLFGSTDPNGGSRRGPINSGALLIANYYLQAAMELPVVSIGYRFK